MQPKRQRLISLVIVLLMDAIRSALAQTSASCVGRSAPTSLPACDGMFDRLSRCAQDQPKEDAVACLCDQAMLNAFVDCKRETRECLLTENQDSDFDQQIEKWHRACDKYITASLTTPAVPPLATTWFPEDCASAAEACLHRDYGITSCKSAYPNATEALSCLCRPTQVAFASRCQIDQTKCLLHASVTVSEIWEYKNCHPTGWPAAETTNGNITGLQSTASTRSITWGPPTESSVNPTFGLRPESTSSGTGSGRRLDGSSVWNRWAVVCTGVLAFAL